MNMWAANGRDLQAGWKRRRNEQWKRKQNCKCHGDYESKKEKLELFFKKSFVLKCILRALKSVLQYMVSVPLSFTLDSSDLKFKT